MSFFLEKISGFYGKHEEKQVPNIILLGNILMNYGRLLPRFHRKFYENNYISMIEVETYIKNGLLLKNELLKPYVD